MDEGSASPRMNQYEKGKHTPDVRTLKLIADELKVPLNYFFCEDPESAELAIAIAIATLSTEKRRLLLKFIHDLSNDES